MARQITPEQFLALLETATADAHLTAALALHETMSAVALEAKGYIGHELNEWKPLADSTIAEKEHLGYVGQESATDPLLRTGELRKSIELEVDAASLTGVVGSNDKIAIYQELGTEKIPPRPFLSTSMFRAQPVAEHLFGNATVKLLSPKR
jgi:hypothetical protein